MKLTNNRNILRPMVLMIEKMRSSYNKELADHTPTSLIAPARLSALFERHKEELSTDVMDEFAKVIGHNTHWGLEQCGKELESEGYIVEKRFYDKFEVDGKVFNVGPKIDCYYALDKHLMDYKTTNVAASYGNGKEEWAIQLNIGAEMLRANGHLVEKLTICAFFKDWKESQYLDSLEASKRNGYNTTNYPEFAYMEFDVPIIPTEEVRSFIVERIKEHEKAKIVLPECTKEERWVRDEQWAITKPKAKRATRVFDNREAAESALKLMDNPELVIEHREGKSIRCGRYCPVAKFCTQYQNSLKKG